jgi:glycine cleavage system aminomethyltransferase T
MALEDFARVDDFGDAAAEATACRTNCALFDFSFLECARLEGKGAGGVIEAFTGRSVAAMSEGKIIYALRVGPAGDVVADLTVWKTGAESFEVMSGRHKDVADLLAYAGPGIDVTDITPERATFAVQGPGSLDALRHLGDVGPIEPLGYFNFGYSNLAGVRCMIGRVGYTGEAGFEIVVARRHASDLWQALVVHAQPAGFVAMDILRIEAGLVLFANEFRLPVSPREAGLGKFYRSADMPQPEIVLVSFRADAAGLRWPWEPSRELKRPVTPGEIVVTSACDSVAAGGILGLGYVLAGAMADANLRDSTATFRNVRLTPMPFYDTAKRHPRALWRRP